MNPALTNRRCITHPHREAISRCPQCRRFYCRECVTEHEGRMLCVACLGSGQMAAEARSGTRWFLWTTAAIAGFLVASSAFYGMGMLLQAIPTGAWSGGGG